MLSQLLKPPSQKCRYVYIYRGEGAGLRSVRSTVDSLQRLLPDSYDVTTLSCQQLLSGSWMAQAALLVMPGGADLPYCKHLNGRGNSLIKDYVVGGGSYLGLCAGAYYAASQVEFEPGSALEVMGDRELGFFPGIARGAAVAGFNYQTEAGAAVVPVQFRVPLELSGQAQGLDSIQLKGSWCTTRDYCNGGPFFLTKGESLQVEQLPGITVLAHYCHDSTKEAFWHPEMTCAITSSCCNLTDAPRRHHQAASIGLSNINGDGGSEAVARQGITQSDNRQDFLPLYHPERHMVPAAVRCEVADGVAVLCGTHPELEPGWLDVCGNAREGPRGQGAEVFDVAAPSSTPTSSAGGSAKESSKQTSNSNDVISAAADGSLSSVDAATTPSASDAGLHHGDRLSIASCRDVRLAAHVQALRQELAECQQRRDLLLSCLLYEVLRRA